MQLIRSRRSGLGVHAPPARAVAAVRNEARRVGAAISLAWERGARRAASSPESELHSEAAGAPRSLARALYPLGLAAVVAAYVLLPLNAGILVLLGGIVLFAWTADAGTSAGK